jgi:hypothetical protein
MREEAKRLQAEARALPIADRLTELLELQLSEARGQIARLGRTANKFGSPEQREAHAKLEHAKEQLRAIKAELGHRRGNAEAERNDR